MADRLIRGLALLCLALPAVAGSGLADPTRPPVAVTAEPAAEGEAAGPVLQSVMIPKKGKPVAMIGGQQVMLGGKYGDSRLTALSEREAVLTGPDGTVRLFLTPGIEKINSIVKTPAARRGQGKGKP
jgi:MSHA biogenesis protein MshK